MAVFSGPRAFYAITFGQFVSLVGSGMTRFGLGIWVLREIGDTTIYGDAVLRHFACVTRLDLHRNTD